jgi:hypothetical protein
MWSRPFPDFRKNQDKIQLNNIFLKNIRLLRGISKFQLQRAYNLKPSQLCLTCFCFCLLKALTSFTLPFAVTPISTPGCEYLFGIYPESAQCSKNYIKCAYGVPHTTPCEPGLAYDDKTHSCNWPDLLDYCSPEGNSHMLKWEHLTYNEPLSLTQNLIYVLLTLGCSQ